MLQSPQQWADTALEPPPPVALASSGCVLVCGGRAFDDGKTLFEALTSIHRQHQFRKLIHGGAKGADALADAWAKSRRVPVKEFPADWSRYGNLAGPMRNGQMLREGRPDLVVPFPGGPGTADLVRQAHKAEMEVLTPIFVFGSNLAGRHGAGSALHAAQHWHAIPGQGRGLQGQSWAIPTKDFHLRTLPILNIGRAVNDFLAYAQGHDDLFFMVVKVGCGLAGYREEQIRPLFAGSPANVELPGGWR